MLIQVTKETYSNLVTRLTTKQSRGPWNWWKNRKRLNQKLWL